MLFLIARETMTWVVLLLYSIDFLVALVTNSMDLFVALKRKYYT